jgi:transcriptional regulator with XRE-family HTH domain
MRMTAYGYDFHQTTIAKVEGAQRPLRVRELADFAALFSVEVQDLIYAPTRSLPEIDLEIAEVMMRLDAARKAAEAAGRDLEAARLASRNAEIAYQTSVAEGAVLEGRLTSLSADRQRLLGWEQGAESPVPEGLNEGVPASPGERSSSPTSASDADAPVLRMLLGAQLRRLRESSGVTAEEAGYAIRSSRSKISRLETGRASLKEHDVVELLKIYGVTDRESVQRLLKLTRNSNDTSWWHGYSDILPSWYEMYIGLEAAAVEIRSYEAQLVPDLLQTREYSREVMSWSHEAPSARVVERRVELQATRQRRLLGKSDPIQLKVVVDEAALRREIGSPEVMRTQIAHLAEMAERPNVALQVLPLHASGDGTGTFKILAFTESDLPECVYLEQLTSALYLDREAEVDQYRKMMDRLIHQALEPDKTSVFLHRLLVES